MTTSVFVIPLSADTTYQTLDVTLEDLPFTLKVSWNERFSFWSLTIAERSGDDILSNIKMVPNYPLTARYRVLGLTGDFYFLNNAGKTYAPTFNDVGTGTYDLMYINGITTDTLPTPLLPTT